MEQLERVGFKCIFTLGKPEVQMDRHFCLPNIHNIRPLMRVGDYNCSRQLGGLFPFKTGAGRAGISISSSPKIQA